MWNLLIYLITYKKFSDIKEQLFGDRFAGKENESYKT